MASAMGGLASAAAAGVALAFPPVAHRLLRRAAPLRLIRRAPSRSAAACSSGCPSPRVAAAPPSASDGSAGTSANSSLSSMSVTVDLSMSGLAGGIPWKVQWQISGAVATTSGGGDVLSSSDGFQPADLQQQLQAQPAGEAEEAQLFRWTPFDRSASIRAAALEVSGWDPELFQARFSDLSAVLPDLPRVLPSLTPAQLLAAMTDPYATAAKVVVLKAALPSTNVGMLLLMHPPFLDPACGPDRLLAGLDHAARVLGGMAVAEEVLQWYPPLLDPVVLDASVAQLKRLVPHLARSCLPSASGRGRQGYGSEGLDGAPPRPGSGGDARQLIHLLGIVMQSEGGAARAGQDSSSAGGSMWWGCS